MTAHAAATHDLTVHLTGSGSGTVVSPDGSINCGSVCSATYDEGTVVTLSATPDPGSVFAGWSGGSGYGCMGQGTCQVAMTGDATVTAEFGALPLTPTITSVRLDPIRRIVTFRFAATGQISGYQCRFVRKGSTAKFASCTSPQSYHQVDPGSYTFTVQTVSAAGGTPTTHALRVPIEFSKCFGAASRDPDHRCGNPALRDAVVPTPSDALLIPNGICRGQHMVGSLAVCSFGVDPAKAHATVVMIGDSHADAWLPAVQYAALTKGWTGIGLLHNGCGFSTARMLVVPSYADECHTWTQEVLAFLQQQPEVSTVVISAFDTRLFATSAQAGFHHIWDALPASVHNIFIIRDVPQALLDESDCVQRALVRHQPAGTECARPRSATLTYDSEAAAAASSRSHRVHLLDYTPFFCDKKVCYPVIGGALVYKDLNHMTVEFATTMGPYVLRSFNQFASG